LRTNSKEKNRKNGEKTVMGPLFFAGYPGRREVGGCGGEDQGGEGAAVTLPGQAGGLGGVGEESALYQYGGGLDAIQQVDAAPRGFDLAVIANYTRTPQNDEVRE
jgi:hypothetical protein